MISKLPKNTLRNLAICAVVLISIAGLMIYPNYVGLKRLEEKVDSLDRQLKEQIQLAPLFATLVQKSRKPTFDRLPFPGPEGLTIEQMSGVGDRLKAMADEAGVVLDSAVPGVEGLVEESGRVGVDAVFSGDFKAFTPLLTDIMKQPYLEFVEHIRIRSKDQGAELRIKMWLLLKSAGT